METSLEGDVFELFNKQLRLDMSCKTPSLLAKWLKSENASSKETKKLGYKTREALGLSAREYRKMLSKLRAKINVLERLMSANRWDEIEFDKIPSRAGFIYRNAFARRDIIKAKYEKFMTSDDTKVNAKTLYPYEIVHQIFSDRGWSWPSADQIPALDRKTYQKYWENLADVLKGYSFNGLCMCDTSGSMTGTPIEVAVSLALYCAEKCSGPYKNHFMTFSSQPRLQEVIGSDITAKVCNLVKAGWQMNTNIEAAFDLILDVAKRNHLSQDEIPQNLIIISDMEFDSCVTTASYSDRYSSYWSPKTSVNKETLFESMRKKWAACGYKMPSLCFWNVDARNDRIPMRVENGITFISGFSQTLFDSIMKGKTGWDLVLDKLLSERYKAVY